MRYDLVDLRVFLAVAEAQNLSRGAERSHIAPSSASLRIRNLEETLGCALFERKARGVTLTGPGRVVADHARRCLTQLEQMHADLMPYVRGVKGSIRMFANNNAISSFLPEDLSRFFLRYPNVRISLEEHLSYDIVAAVAAGRAEIGIGAWEFDLPGLAYHPYREDRMVLLVPHESPLSRTTSTRFATCVSAPFISLQSGAAIHRFMVNQAAALGHELDIRVQVSRFEAIATLVASGAGIGLIPKSLISRAVSPKCAVVTLEEPWALRRLKICSRPESLSNFSRKLIEHLASSEGAANEA